MSDVVGLLVAAGVIAGVCILLGLQIRKAS